MTTQPDVRSLIRSLVEDDPTGDPEIMARKVVATVTEPDAYFWLVRHAIIRQMRSFVEGVERAAFAGTFSAKPSVATTATTQGAAGDGEANVAEHARAKLLSQRFYINDERGYVLWGEATEQDHLDRVEYLKSLRSGIDQSIGRHQKAIALLHQFGANSLGEISDVEINLGNDIGEDEM